MKTKRLISMMIILSFIVGLFIIPESASATTYAPVDYSTDFTQGDFGPLDMDDGAYQNPASAPKAAITYKILGKSDSVNVTTDGITSLSDLPKASWDVGKYLWVGVSVKNMTKLERHYKPSAERAGTDGDEDYLTAGLHEFQMSILADADWLEYPEPGAEASSTSGTNIADMFNTLKILNTDTAISSDDYYYTSFLTKPFDYSTDYTASVGYMNMGMPGTMGNIGLTGDNLLVISECFSHTSGKPYMFTTGDRDDDEHLLLVFPLLMKQKVGTTDETPDLSNLIQPYMEYNVSQITNTSEESRNYFDYHFSGDMLGTDSSSGLGNWTYNFYVTNANGSVLGIPEGDPKVKFEIPAHAQFANGGTPATSISVDAYTPDSGTTFYIQPSMLQDAENDFTSIDTNYAFEGWYENYDSSTGAFTNKYSITADAAITASKTLYAKFVESYPLEVDTEWNGSAGNSWFLDSGSAKTTTNTYSIPKDETDSKFKLTKTKYDAIKADVKVATGYEIEGIYTDSGFTNKIDESTLTDSNPIEVGSGSGVVNKLYVKTQRKTLDVTFYWDATNTDTVTLQASETDDKFYLTNIGSDLLTTEKGKFTLPSTKNFDGWYYESTYTTKANENDVVNSTKKDLYAKLTDKVMRTVTFDSNGGNPTTAQTVQVEDGKALSTGLTSTEQIAFTAADTLTGSNTWKVAAPTRTGYTFAGWYIDPTSSTETALADATGTISGDTTYKAKWTRNSINVTLTAFDFQNDATDSTSWFLDTTSTPVGTTPFEIKESTTTAGEYKITSVSDLDALLKLKDKSYEIEGWYTDAGFTSTNKISDGYTISDPSNPPTLYAKVQKIQKTVTFSVAKPSNAATGDTSYDNLKFTDTNNTTTTATLDADPTDGKVYLTQAAMDAAEAIITGYPNSHEFSGWYSDETRSTSATTSLEIGSSTVVYAKTGEKTQITITFESDAGTTFASVMVHEGNSFNDEGKKVKWTSPSEASPTVGNPTKAGYTFDGWYLNPADTSTGAFTESTTFTTATTYIAKWNEDTKNATFHADAHSNFGGTASDTKVYKIWADATPKYTVTYTTVATTPAGATAATKSNTGIAEDDITVDTGYEIEGWYKDSGFTQKITADYDITADTDVYVKTQRIEYDVTFALGGTTTGVQYDTSDPADGTGDAATYTKTLQADTTTGKVTVDATADLNDAKGRITGIPNKYEFGGWYTDAGCTTPYTAGDITGDTTLYANIKEKTKYDVKFEASDATTAYTTVTISVHDGLTLLQEDASNTVEKTNTDTSVTTFKVPNPVRTNYRFVGWYENPSDTSTGAYTEATTFTAAKTYKAAWVEDTVDVTFKDTKASPQADIVYTVNANKKLSDSDANGIVKNDGSGILKVGGTAVATGAAVADVPDDPTPAANYMFYGWYTLKDNTVDLNNDVLTKTTKTAMDALVTAGDIIEFDDNVSVGTTAFNVYALYVLSDNAKLKPNDDDGDPDGAVFKEFNASGVDIPFTASDYLPVQEPEHAKAAIIAAGDTPPTYNLGGRTATTNTFDPDKTYKSTDTPPNEFYMVVENVVDKAYTELTTVNPGSTLVIKKKGLDTDGVTVIWTTVTSTPDSTTGTNTATLDLDVTENKSANEFLVTITAPDGTTEAQYKFNILRYAVPEIKLGYGNTPYGLIDGDPEWDDATKAAAKTAFSGGLFNKNYGTGLVPIISGSRAAGTAVEAPHARPYSTYAWKSYNTPVTNIKNNYDMNSYAYVVYQGEKFNVPGYDIINEFGETVTGTSGNQIASFEFERQTIPRAVSYLPADASKYTPIASSALRNAANPNGFNLLTKMIRPNVYQMDYDYDLTSVYGNTESLHNERPLIVTSFLGDTALTAVPITNAADATNLTKTHASINAINKTNSLLTFRVADVALPVTTIPIANAADGTYLTKNHAAIHYAKYKYYPTIY